MAPVSNHLMETESEFAPWDPSKAHILVSTPAHAFCTQMGPTKEVYLLYIALDRVWNSGGGEMSYEFGLRQKDKQRMALDWQGLHAY